MVYRAQQNLLYYFLSLLPSTYDLNQMQKLVIAYTEQENIWSSLSIAFLSRGHATLHLAILVGL